MNEKIDKYFKLLHPEYDTLTLGKQFEVMDDMSFIVDNIDEIDKYYEGYMREESGTQQEGLTEQEIIAKALRKVKIEKYFEILHPEYDTLTLGKQFEVMDDMSFIVDNIDEIDEMYTTQASQAETRGEDINKQEIIKSAIEGIQCLQKNREPQKTMDTAEDIVKNEEIDSEGIIPIDEAKFAQVYGKSKGRIKEVFSKIKSFLNIKSNDRNDKTNDENIK